MFVIFGQKQKCHIYIT